MKLFYNRRISKYCFLYLIILPLILSMINVSLKSGNYSFAASIRSEEIPKIVKNKIEKILGDVKYLSVKKDNTGDFIIIVQKNMIKYEVVVDKNKKILKILSIVKDETPEMGC